MKKVIVIISITVICLITANIITKKTEDELRIRVIASSDSSYDQQVKGQVVEMLSKNIIKFNQDDIINEIKNNIDILDENLNKMLKDSDYSIGITNEKFPTKKLDGRIISGGFYPTLLVVIGKGEGKNWWSLLNPSYHNINFDSLDAGEVEFKFFFFK